MARLPVLPASVGPEPLLLKLLRPLSFGGLFCPEHIARGVYSCDVCAPWVLDADSRLFHRQLWAWTDPPKAWTTTTYVEDGVQYTQGVDGYHFLVTMMMSSYDVEKQYERTYGAKL